MKKLLLLFVCTIFSASILTAQTNVARELVVMEIFGGTWCQFCPGSALGGDDMVHNGHSVAVIDHHVGDVYQTAASSARDGMYPTPGYPTTFFDGIASHVGGHLTNSIYGTYLSYYNNRIAVPTPIAMELELVSNVNNTVQVQVRSTQTGNYSGTNLRVFLVLTESHIQANWFGLTELNFVNRVMLPDANGKLISLGLGVTDTSNFTVNLNPSWVKRKSELVAFVQDMSTMEIMQGSKQTLNLPDYNVDVIMDGLSSEISATVCGGLGTPEVLVRNDGADTLVSLDIEYSINGGPTNTYNWTGSLAFDETEAVPLPAVTYTPMATGNTLDVLLTNPNGGTDENLGNESFSTAWDEPTSTANKYEFEIKVDIYGTHTTWEILYEDGTVIASGGPYPNNSPTIHKTPFRADSVGCFQVKVYDSNGDGITFPSAGYFKVTDSAGTTLFTGSGAFEDEAEGNFYAEGTPPDYAYDASIEGTTEPIAAHLCPGELMPEIIIQNNGGQPLTTLDITYSVNGGTPQTIAWTGMLEHTQTESVALTGITYTPLATGNTLDVALSNPNGQQDENESNGEVSYNWNEPSAVYNEFEFAILTDMFGSETTWELVSSNANQIAAGGPYADGTVDTFRTAITVPGADCYTVNVMDAGGNGITAGYFELTDIDGNIVISSDEAFESAVSNNFYTSAFSTSIRNLLDEGLTQVYPNPSTGHFSLDVKLSSPSDLNVTVFQTNGKAVYSQRHEQVNGQFTTQMDLSDQPSGIYLVNIQTKEGIYTHKLHISK